MKHLPIGLKEVQSVYNGAEGKLWELIMGEQIHIGGFAESMVLAKKAGIQKGDSVLDLCCALGAGLRFLVRNFDVLGFGLDGTSTMIQKAQQRIDLEGLSGKISLKSGTVLQIPWPDQTFDIVWGEDAWCYVEDKDTLIGEAARVLKQGGTLAFSDWIEGKNNLSEEEAFQINTFMKFPYMESLQGYERLIAHHGLTLLSSEDLNSHFASCIELYIRMLTEQLTFDALNIIGNNMELFQQMGSQMQFMLQMAQASKLSRGRWIAIKK